MPEQRLEGSVGDIQEKDRKGRNQGTCKKENHSQPHRAESGLCGRRARSKAGEATTLTLQSI